MAGGQKAKTIALDSRCYRSGVGLLAGVQCPIGVTAHSTRGMASSWANVISIGEITKRDDAKGFTFR